MIIHKSNIDKNLIDRILKHPFLSLSYEEKMFLPRKNLTNWISPNQENLHDYELAVLQFLNKEKYDHKNLWIEYWFQNLTGPSRGLEPHCDLNQYIRGGGDYNESPTTIAVYLLTDIKEDEGNLCISEWTSLDEKNAMAEGERLNEIKKHKYHRIIPKAGNVIYFNGSQHYHWIEPITSGKRISMLINFWDRKYE